MPTLSPWPGKSEKILQEDSKHLMWYDQAVTRSGEDV